MKFYTKKGDYLTALFLIFMSSMTGYILGFFYALNPEYFASSLSVTFFVLYIIFFLREMKKEKESEVKNESSGK